MKKHRCIPLPIGFAMLAHLALAQQCTVEAVRDKFGTTVTVERDKATGTVERISDLHLNTNQYSAPVSTLDSSAVAFMVVRISGDYQQIIGVSACDFVVDHIRRNAGVWHVLAHQAVAGVPVMSSSLRFAIEKNGNVQALNLRVLPSRVRVPTSPAVGIQDAVGTALHAFVLEFGYSGEVVGDAPILAIKPRGQDRMQCDLVWVVTIRSAGTGQRLRVAVDAMNGQVVETIRPSRDGTVTVQVNKKYWLTDGGGSSYSFGAIQNAVVRLDGSSVHYTDA